MSQSSQIIRLPLRAPGARRSRCFTRGSGFALPSLRVRSLTRPQLRAFTLIELLVVIAIIAVLAGLLLPVLSTVFGKEKIKRAKIDMAQLSSAIHSYEAEYSRMPISKEALLSASPDFTFGTVGLSGYPSILNNNGAGYQANNSELLNILRNINNNPYNTHQTPFFNPKNWTGPGTPGIDSNGVFRDPWGHPYIITVDVNDDNQSLDSYYDRITRRGPAGTGLLVSGQVMIWSLGADGQASDQLGPKEGVNKDNVLSW